MKTAAERRQVLSLVAPLLEKIPYEAVLSDVTNLVLDEIKAAVAEERARCAAVARSKAHFPRLRDCPQCETSESIAQAIERSD